MCLPDRRSAVHSADVFLTQQMAKTKASRVCFGKRISSQWLAVALGPLHLPILQLLEDSKAPATHDVGGCMAKQPSGHFFPREEGLIRVFHEAGHRQVFVQEGSLWTS